MKFLFLFPLTFFMVGCAAPVSQVPTGTKEEIAAEFLTQQIQAQEQIIEREKRIRHVGMTMLEANADLCGENVAYHNGLVLWTRNNLPKDQRDELGDYFGLDKRYQVMLVDKGFAADRAGIRPGDIILSINGVTIPETRAAKTFEKIQKESFDQQDIDISVERNGNVLDKRISRDLMCNYGIAYWSHDTRINAFADGDNVIFTAGMMNYLRDNNTGLETIMAHEIAHNLMQHIPKAARNRGIGAFGGALLDVAALAAGVNTNGQFSQYGAGMGGLYMSPDFEHEADYVGLYIMARSGYDISNAANLWRELSLESGGPNDYRVTHPTNPERFVSLDKTIKEIKSKKARGVPLEPNFEVLDTAETHYDDKAETGWWN